MPRLTPDQRQNLRASNPDGVIMRSKALPNDDFVFRPVSLAEFDAFLGAINGSDTTARVYAHRALAKDCALFPAPDAFDAMMREHPGVAHSFGDELAKRAGINAEIVSDVL